MAGVELEIKEANGQDAAAIIRLISELSKETEYITLLDASFSPSVDLLAEALEDKVFQENSICLLVYNNDELIALCHVASDQHYATQHIGDLFIAIKRDYWGHGIGSWLMEEVIYWAETSGIIKRLELTVQARNKAAVHLYEKFGFVIEGTKIRGAKTENGEYLDVYYMGRLID